MTYKKIAIRILCAAIVGGLVQAGIYFPELAALFASIAAIVAGFGSIKNGSDNSTE